MEGSEFFIVSGGHPPTTGMRANGAIKCFNISEHCKGSLIKGGEVSKIQAFTFEATEEVFRDSVIIGITLTAHALDEASILESVSKADRSVLDTAIGVKNQA